MIDYFLQNYNKLLLALMQHLQLVVITMVLSLVLTAILVIFCYFFRPAKKVVMYLFSIIYSVPSLAMFAMLIPLTGLGTTTTLIVLVVYNQYILLRTILTALDEVDEVILDAAKGMGFTKLQILYYMQLPLSFRAILTAIRLAIISTISIATIAAFINAGGLGVILYDGLRTMNVIKIAWGTILLFILALSSSSLIKLVEKRAIKNEEKYLK